MFGLSGNVASMAHKRQRHNDGDSFVGDGIGGCGCGDRFLSLFGKDAIHEIGGGNPMFARGGFGELSVALKSRKGAPSTDGEKNLQYSFAAVKTIHNAMTGGSNNNNRFGSFGQASEQEQSKELSSDVVNELLALRLLQLHPNIVPLIAVYPSSQGALSLAFDYCPMDLREVLEVRRKTFRQPLAFRFVQTIVRDLFGALVHCHTNGILHRDLKPGNLLVSSKGVIRLCDFGLARPFLVSKEIDAQKKSAINNDKVLCTLYYRPPEVLLGGPAEHPSVDSWSAGVVLAELITGRPVWPGRNVIDQLTHLFESLGTPNEEKWPSVKRLPDYRKLIFGFKPPKRWEETLPRASESPALVDLLSNLVVLNPAARFTAKEVLDHDWLLPKSGVSLGGFDNECHRELRDELLLPASLQIPLLLFPENRALVEKLGLGIAESRRSLLKKCGNHWQGPTLKVSLSS